MKDLSETQTPIGPQLSGFLPEKILWSNKIQQALVSIVVFIFANSRRGNQGEGGAVCAEWIYTRETFLTFIP